MTAHQAIKNAIKALPRGRVRDDLRTVARLLDWKRKPGSSYADAGAVVIRFNDRFDKPKDKS